MICLPRIAFYRLLGERHHWRTSWDHDPYFHHCLHLQFTFCFYFQLQSPLSLSLAFDPLYTARPEVLTTPLYSLGTKLLVVCEGPCQLPSVKQVSSTVDTILYLYKSY